MRPPRPKHPGVTGPLWKLIQRCWNGDPRLRPEASEVLQILLDSSVFHLFWRSSIHKLEYVLASSNPPLWERLTNPTMDVDDDPSDATPAYPWHFPDESDAAEDNSGRISPL